MKKLLVYFSALFLSSSVFYSCSSSSQSIKKEYSIDNVDTSKFAPCVSSYLKNTRIRWGQCIKSDESVFGYELRPDGAILKYYGVENRKYEYIGEAASSDFCRFFKMMQDTMAKIPTYSVSGNFSKFVEIQNPANSFYFRALWNSDFKTYGSTCYRAIFDSLNALLERANKKTEQ